MKMWKKLTAALLAAALLPPISAPVRADSRAPEAEAVTASVTAAVRLDYIQKWDKLVERDLQAELFREGTSLGKVSLTKPEATAGNGCTFEVSVRDREGGARTGTALPGALSLSVSGLARGNYTLRLTGKGYADCGVPFEISGYSKYIEVGTGDGTFALGDFNGDKTVDEKDRDLLSGALGSTRRADLDQYDLNGDGKVDIVDLAYVNRSAHTSGGAPVILNTACLSIPLDEAEAEAALSAAGTELTGELADLFREDSPPVRFERSGGGGGNIVIPIPFQENDPLELQELQIVTPAGGGAVRKGYATVEYGENDVKEIDFDNPQPAGVQTLARSEGESVITIDLGKRVAVKKVTITVTETEGGSYAVVETVRFLRDIVPENVTDPNREVKNLRAAAGDGQVELSWDALPNVSGYRVRYWPKGQETAARQLNVNVTGAWITGLDNLKTYCFTVIPTDGAWEGVACPAVEAAPQPAGVPGAPDMVTVKELDGQLALSWKAGKNAAYYEVYYTDRANAAPSEYRQFGARITGTGVTVTGLTNGTAYYLYVVAGNSAGRSGPSRISTGTPAATDYSRPAGIPAKGILDNSMIESVRLANPGNVDAGAYTPDAPFDVKNIIDGDFKTHWTAGGWNGDEHVIVTFKQPVDLTAAIWVPRLDGEYPSYLRAYSVRVWYEGDDLNGPGRLLVPDPEKGGRDDEGGRGSDVHTWPNMPNYSSIASDRFGIMPFGPAIRVKKLSLAAEQRDYLRVSLSELMFVKYDEAHCLPDDIAALFADGARTRLADGVTRAQIDGLKGRLAAESKYYLHVAALEDELALARELLESGTSGGVVLEGVQSRSGSADAEKYKQSGSELQPLGAAARAGQELTIYASGIPEGGRIAVIATQFNAEANAWQKELGTLANGRNILTVPTIGSGTDPQRGGSLYLTYSGAKPEDIRLHVRRAVDIPVLELSDWYKLEESARKARIGTYVDELDAYVSAQGIDDGNKAANCLNVTELSMPTVLLSLPAAAVLGANGLDREEKIENLYQNVLAWEDLMHICKTTQGIDSTYEKNDMASRQNIRCMQMFEGAFMYAAGNHIGIGYGSCAGMVSGLPIARLGADAAANDLFGWGIAHEIGHNMDKLGRAEITNNIYSLMVQTYDGRQNTLPSRLEGKYPEIFSRTAQGWPGESNDVFLQLGLYWQLHLAYDGAEKPLDFYNQFFKAWKAGTYFLEGASYDEKVALTASGVAGKNLTEFFTRWGMALSGEVKAKLAGYEKEARAIWYLSDQSRRERLKGASPAAGTVTASAQPEGEKTVRVTVSASLTQGALQGFEIIRDGKPVAFVVPGPDGKAVYDDVIGSGNHRTYSYQAAAYDILGNKLGEAVKTGEVRVAYDQTVDPSAYTVTRDRDTVSFQFKESTAVSGLKLSGDNRPTAGDYTIAVNGKQVRAGSFDKGNQTDTNSYLVYLQKPGAAADDTRIWTYDAKTVTVTGVPSAVADTDLRLISYAGDDVALREGGAVGRLSADYKYGGGTDDVIKAGTLVIVGAYRGDPVYNDIRLEGRFAKAAEKDGAEIVYEERPINGYVLMFAEIPADGQVSDISDGLFIFVPDVQKEAALQEIARCDGVNLLPSQLRAVMTRSDTPGDTKNRRETARTLWTMTPGGADLPVIALEGGAK